MSILIKGMEMPKNEPLLVKINPDGTVSTTAKNGYRKYEAVPVPPHGRLGDLDALHKLFLEKAKEYKSIGSAMVAMAALCIANAPTIIEAEEGET